MDRGLLEFLGPQGISAEIYKYTNKINQISLGFVFYYLFLLIGSLVAFLLIFSGWAFIPTVLDINLVCVLVLTLFFLAF